MTLPEFLLARIAEDEAVALDAAGWDRSGRGRSTGRWQRVGISSLEDDERRSVIYSDNNQVSETVADHIARRDPARVLAGVAAKRAIVELHTPSIVDVRDIGPMVFCEICDDGNPCETLRLLASVYADHPDYRQDWKP